MVHAGSLVVAHHERHSPGSRCRAGTGRAGRCRYPGSLRGGTCRPRHYHNPARPKTNVTLKPYFFIPTT